MPGGIEGGPKDPLKRYDDPEPLDITEEPLDVDPIQPIRQKAQGFLGHMTAIQRMPETSAWAIARSPMSRHRAARFGYSMDTGVEWSDTLTTFAGLPGVLTSAYNTSMTLKDKGVRAASTKMLNRLRSLPMDQQVILMPYLQGEAPLDPAAANEVMEMMFGIGAEYEEGRAGTVFRGQVVEGQEAGVTVEGSDIATGGGALSVDDVAAMRIAFPKFALRFDDDYKFTESADLAQQDFMDDVYSRAPTIERLLEIRDLINSGDMSIAEAIPKFAGNFVGVGSQLGWSTWGDIGRDIPFTRGFVGEMDTNFAALGETLFGVWDENDEQRTGYLAELLDGGMDPQDEGYAEMMESRAGLLVIFLPAGMHSIGKIARATRLVRNAVDPESAAQKLAGLREQVEPRTGILGTTAEAYRLPVRKTSELIHKQILKLARSPEEWFSDGFNGRPGRRLLDVMAEAKAKFPDSGDAQVSYVWNVYGKKIDARMIRVGLEQSSREGAKRALIDAIGITPGKSLAGLRKAGRQASQKRATIARMIEDRERATDSLVDGEVLTVPARDLLGKLEFPDRARVGEGDVMTGRTPEQVAALRRDLAGGYDPERPTALGGRTGEIEVEFYPETGRLVVREGHHRLGLLAETDQRVPIKVRVMEGDAGGNTGANIVDVRDAGIRSLDDLSDDLIDEQGKFTLSVLIVMLKNDVATRAADEAPALQLDWLNRIEFLENGLREGTAKWSDLESLVQGRDRIGVGEDQVLSMVNHPDSTAVRRTGSAFDALSELSGPAGALDDPRFSFGDADIRAWKGQPSWDLASLNKLAILRAEAHVLEKRIATDSFDNPMLEFPRTNSLRNIVQGVPRNSFEKLVYGALRGPGTNFMQKFVDEMPSRPKLFVPGSEDYPANGLAQNIETLSTAMRRLGVGNETIGVRVSQLSRITDREDFFQFIEHVIFGEEGDIAQSLARLGTDPAIAREVLRLHDTPVDQRYQTKMYGREDSSPGGPVNTERFVLQRRLPDGSLIPQPSRPSDLLSRPINLPSVDMMVEATSWIRRNIRKVDHLKGGKKIAGVTARTVLWDAPRFALNIFTKLGKPMVLAPRVVAMTTRIQLEQGIRAHSFGYRPIYMPEGLSILPGGILIPGTKHRLFANLFGEKGWKLLDPDPRYPRGPRTPGAPDPDEIGNMLNLESEMYPERVWEDMADVNNGAEPKTRHYDGVVHAVERANEDFLDNLLAQNGFDPRRTLAALNSTDKGRALLEQFDPILRRSTDFDGVDIDAARLAWLTNEGQYLRSLVGDNPVLVKYLKTGAVDDVTHIPIEQRLRYAHWGRELQEIKAEMRRINKEGGAPEVMRALVDSKKRILNERQKLVQKHPELKSGSVKGDRSARMRDALKAEFEAGNYRFPQKVQTHRGIRNRGDTNSGWEDIDMAVDSISTVLYKGLKPATWADTKGTRGSMFSQAFRRHTEALRARKYSQRDAEAIGYVRAARETRDLMYDLNARTSVQRALKDLFWFAPATQEVLYTWLVKIPAQYYWPIGIAKMGSDLFGIITALKEVGIVSEGPNGEDRINVPSIFTGPFFDALMPGKFPDQAYGKLSGLNLVFNNFGIPSLSTAPNFLLGKSALKFGGVFKKLSDVLQPYGPNQSGLTQPVLFGWEALTGSPPPFEFLADDVQRAQWDRSIDIGIQYAYSDLFHQGVKPPHIEDYGTKNAAGDYDLSPEQEEDYMAARDSYLATLLKDGKDYAMGTAFVRLLGATVAPMSIYTTSEERDNWLQFFQAVVGSVDDDEPGFTNTQRDLIDNFLKEHPQSMAYSVWTTEYGEKERDLPFEESMDDAFFDREYTGERRTLGEREYAENLMASESKRYYLSKLDAAQRAISPEKDAWALLTHGYERSDATEDYYDSWDRYQRLNPEVAGRLLKQQRLWAESNDVPQQSTETERLAEGIHIIKDIGQMMSGDEGIRPDYIKETLIAARELWNATNPVYGEVNTESQKRMAWYFNEVIDPFFERTTDLYAEADNLTAAGLPASHIYDQIRTISNEAPPTYAGETVPSVEEVFFGNKMPEEKKVSINAWISRPLAWLSNFQLDQAGYDVSTSGRELLENLNELDASFYEYIDNENITSGSKDYEIAQASRDKQAKELATQYGDEGLKLLALNEAQPYVRLNVQGFGGGNAAWSKVVEAATSVVQYIESEDMSVKGYSQDVAMPAKTWFYNTIATLRESDPDFDEMLDNLARSFPTPGGDPRQGALFYEAVFFGNFSVENVPVDLAKIGV